MSQPTVLMLIGSDFVGARHKARLERAPQLRVVTDPAQCELAEVDAIFTFKLPAGIAPGCQQPTSVSLGPAVGASNHSKRRQLG